MTTRIAIIGGGAAGCFAAICLKERMPEAFVTVYESGNKLLAKVAELAADAATWQTRSGM